MNGIENITRRIQADAQAEIDGVLSAARDEAQRITAGYRAQAESEERELSAKNAKAADQREERLVSTAQMEARKVILAAKQDVVEEAYALALEKLCTMPEDKYITVLSDLLVQASASGTEEAVFSAKDRPGVGKAAVEKANAASGKHLTLSDQTADIRGGFILKDRNVEVNCAFETLVRLQKAETAGAVVKKLF
ncbi:MAG: V-type ATP synthase subunit E [Oscillibacter sp.]|nr:V-type ATP synthase subunit E [Oscillibacter sp.]